MTPSESFGLRLVTHATSRENYVEQCEASVINFRRQVDNLQCQHVYEQDIYKAFVESVRDPRAGSPTGYTDQTRWTHIKGGKKVGTIVSYRADGILYLGVARCNPRDKFHPAVGLYKALVAASVANDSNMEERKKELPENYQASFEHLYARTVPVNAEPSDIPC